MGWVGSGSEVRDPEKNLSRIQYCSPHDSGGRECFPVRANSRALYPAAAGPARPGQDQDPLPQVDRNARRSG
jgi:hypothetical protein